MKFGRGRRGERKSRIYTHKAIFYNKYTGNIEIPETIEHKVEHKLSNGKFHLAGVLI